jgi:glycosyltransferase involved in cell wall biosynthesis
LKLLVVTDAWRPQTNGVVTTLENVIARVERAGHVVDVIEPGRFRTLPLPSYPEIRVAVNPWTLGRLIDEAQPDGVHIATEGPLGLAARRYLKRRRIAFTTSLHTKFPEYVHARVGVPLSLGYAFLRRFHGDAACTLVTTESHRVELAARGFERLVVWGRGVDTERFRPRPRRPREVPRLLYVGRVAVEKNLEAFLALDVPGCKVVVGDGPARAALEARYPDVEWLGFRHGDALVECYADADVFVFPSRTDTFGLVMLEAMACGTPVAAFPVTGPIDVVVEGVNGSLDRDLATAIDRALAVDRASCRAFALRHSWDAIAERLLAAQIPIEARVAHTAAS